MGCPWPTVSSIRRLPRDVNPRWALGSTRGGLRAGTSPAGSGRAIAEAVPIQTHFLPFFIFVIVGPVRRRRGQRSWGPTLGGSLMVVLPGLHVLWCVHTLRALLVFTTRGCGVQLGWVRLSLVRLSRLSTGGLLVWSEGEVEVKELLAGLSGGPCVRYPERVGKTPGLAVGAGELQPRGRGSAGPQRGGSRAERKTSRAGRGWCDGVMLRAARQGSLSISPSAPADGHRDALSGDPAHRLVPGRRPWNYHGAAFAECLRLHGPLICS